ncbi:agmatinase family protein [Arenibaculum sp.]|uniref:agmatinase family protein n=1 Tax=Arenibaculum sp. TaxID=2865862 RepID=UPI002E1491C0|nr:agmatinase family protein [Arenibaculum sp.]
MSTQVVQDESVRWIAESWARPGSPRPEGPRFSFLGIPMDYAVSHRAGTRHGPAAIRAALNTYSLYCTDKRISLAAAGLVDHGDVDVVHDLSTTYANIRRAVAEIDPGDTVVCLGGDHSIADPIVRGLQDRLGHRRLGVIVFDAHFDARPPVPGKEHSGHWMKTLEDVIDYGSAVQLGISAPIYSEAYAADAEQKGVLVLTPYEIRRAGWRETIARSIAHATRNTGGVYISVDIDAIYQSHAPGTSVPNPAGLLPHEVMDGVFEIALSAPTVGIDVNEVSPPLDTQDFTAHVAAHVVLNFMAGVVARRSGRNR